MEYDENVSAMFASHVDRTWQVPCCGCTYRNDALPAFCANCGATVSLEKAISLLTEHFGPMLVDEQIRSRIKDRNDVELAILAFGGKIGGPAWRRVFG
jgi:hypothetical protein